MRNDIVRPSDPRPRRAIVLYVSLGAAGRRAAARVGRREAHSPWEWALLAAGLVATVVATVLLSRAARRELAKTNAAAKTSRAPSRLRLRTPGHRFADVKLKWRELRMELGRPPDGSSPAQQREMGLSLDATLS